MPIACLHEAIPERRNRTAAYTIPTSLVTKPFVSGGFQARRMSTLIEAAFGRRSPSYDTGHGERASRVPHVSGKPRPQHSEWSR